MPIYAYIMINQNYTIHFYKHVGIYIYIYVYGNIIYNSKHKFI